MVLEVGYVKWTNYNPCTLGASRGQKFEKVEAMIRLTASGIDTKDQNIQSVTLLLDTSEEALEITFTWEKDGDNKDIYNHTLKPVL